MFLFYDSIVVGSVMERTRSRTDAADGCSIASLGSRSEGTHHTQGKAWNNWPMLAPMLDRLLSMTTLYNGHVRL